MLASLAFAVDLQPIRLGSTRPQLLLSALEEPLMKSNFIHVVRQRPARSSAPRSLQVTVSGGRADPHALTDLSIAESLAGQAQDFANLPHGCSLRGTQSLLVEVGSFPRGHYVPFPSPRLHVRP